MENKRISKTDYCIPICISLLGYVHLGHSTDCNVSKNQLADRTYPLIGDLIDEWDNIRNNTGRYSETATRVVGALQNVLNVLLDISREHKEEGMGGHDFSRFPHPDYAGYDW